MILEIHTSHDKNNYEIEKKTLLFKVNYHTEKHWLFFLILKTYSKIKDIFIER